MNNPLAVRRALSNKRRPHIGLLQVFVTPLLLGVLATGCSNDEDLVPDKTKVASAVGGVGHYGSGITITEFSVNGFRGGRVEGWGGGGASHCCVLLPRVVRKRITVNVKWATTRWDVDEFREHEATVPVHFAVQPGEGSGLYVHFLPGHRVEAWVSWPSPASSKYPGPKYPGGPPIAYVPLADEKLRQQANDSEAT